MSDEECVWCVWCVWCVSLVCKLTNLFWYYLQTMYYNLVNVAQDASLFVITACTLSSRLSWLNWLRLVPAWKVAGLKTHSVA